MCRCLVSLRASVLTPGTAGTFKNICPLQVIAANGNLPTMQALLTAPAIEAQIARMPTHLQLEAVVCTLFESSPYHETADMIQMLDFLVSNGLQLAGQFPNSQGRTVLMIACALGSEQGVKSLSGSICRSWAVQVRLCQAAKLILNLLAGMHACQGCQEEGRHSSCLAYPSAHLCSI